MATTNTRYTGRVKWFNNHAGYGFITIVNTCDKIGTDIFVHHTGISSGQNQYKYLVQGEYVDFELKPSDTNSGPKYEVQATNVTGVCNGKLMCETRQEARQDRPANQKTPRQLQLPPKLRALSAPRIMPNRRPPHPDNETPKQPRQPRQQGPQKPENN